MPEIGLAEAPQILMRTEFGEAEFRCEADKEPPRMIDIAYEPPTCRLMSSDTGGTGMPMSKDWEREVIPL